MTAGAPAGGPSPVLLALRPLGLGDLLTAVPALRALADGFPGHHRVLATSPAVLPLALHAGLADQVLPAEPLQPLGGVPGPVDVAVNLHGRGPESHRILARTQPRRLVAFGCGSVDGPDWREDEHQVVRWCRLLDESGVPADPARLDIDPPDRAVSAGFEGATVIHPGAASAARRWPADRFAAVARAEAEAGRRVVVTGGPSEVALVHAVAAAARHPQVTVRAGGTDVLDFTALVAVAGRVVCGDTGVAHLATGLGRPSVVLFGPVSPTLWGPPRRRPQHIALWAGRRGDPHGRHVDPGLLEIGVPDVLRALRRLDRT